MSHSPRASQRRIATILFTDIVGSTDHAAEIGDRRWRDLRNSHNAIVRTELRRFGGHEVETTGDGFLATFASPAPAIRAALSIVEKVRALGIEIRAGVHTGEIEVFRSDVAGIGVHIGARIAAQAGASEVYVSGSTKDLMSGSGFAFDDRGEHELKGVPGSWRIFSVQAAPDEDRMPKRWGRAIWVAVAVLAAVGVAATVLVLTRTHQPLSTTGPCASVALGQGAVEFVPLTGGSPQCELGSFVGLTNSAISPSGNQIVFVGAQARSRQIFVWDARSRRARPITRGTNPVSAPAWSPDGSHVVFVRGVTHRRLYVIESSGGKPVLLGNDLDVTSPAWSSRGQIAFVRVQDRLGCIWVIQANGEGQHNLMNCANRNDRDPAWSRDGASIAFVRHRLNRSSIWVLRLGSNDPRLVTDPQFDAAQPAWGPDGSIAFVRVVGDNTQIWVVRPDHTYVKLTNGPHDHWPTWSADGQRVYFVHQP